MRKKKRAVWQPQRRKLPRSTRGLNRRSKKLRKRLLWSGLADLPLICKTDLSSNRSRKPKLKHRMRLSLSPVYIYLMKRVVIN